MSNLAPGLRTPDGPTKRVIDPGPVNDPWANALQGISSIINTADTLSSAISSRKDDKVRAARQARSDELAENRELRAVQNHEWAIEDRVDNAIEEDRRTALESDFHSRLRELNKINRGVQQGTLPVGAADIYTENMADTLFTKYPEDSEHLATLYRENGVRHLYAGAIDDTEEDAETVDKARNQAFTTGYTTAMERGLALPGMSDAEVSAAGLEALTEDANREIALDRLEMAVKQAGLTDREREFEQTEARKELGTILMGQVNRTGKMVTQSALGLLDQIQTVEQFNDFQAMTPQVHMHLEGLRIEALESAGQDEKLTKRINESFDRHKDFLTELTSGDLSHAQRMRDTLNVYKYDAGLTAAQVVPGHFFIQELGLDKYVTEQLGTTLLGTDGFNNMIADYADQVLTEDSRRADNLLGAVRDKTDIKALDQDTARDLITLNAAINTSAKEAYIRNVQGGRVEESQQNLSDFLDSTATLIHGTSQLLDTANSLEDLNTATTLVFDQRTAWMLTEAVDTEGRGSVSEGIMKASRALAFDVLENISRHTDDRSFTQSLTQDPIAWKTKFDADLGRYVSYVDEDQTRRNLRFKNFGGESSATRGIERAVTSKFTEGIIREASNSNAPDHVRDKLDTMNRTLSFLDGIRKYDSSLNQEITSSEFRQAVAEGRLGDVVNLTVSEGSKSATQILNEQEPDLIQLDNAIARLSTFRTSDEDTAPSLDSAAQLSGLPAALIHSVADQETGAWSGEERHSKKGDNGKAKGVMQIHRAAAEELGYTWEELDDPELNAQAGAEYLSKYIKYYDGDIYLGLLAYNGGPGNVNRWIKDGRPLDGRTWLVNADKYADEVISRMGGQSEDTEG